MATKKFKCELCGYIHEGDAAPAKCPKCGAGADAFTEIVEPMLLLLLLRRKVLIPAAIHIPLYMHLSW